MGTQQFCLRWNNHQTNLLAVFDQLLQNEAFVDVTLACEGLSIKAHKMVLSACSPYFQSLFVENPCQHPIVILKDVRFSELKAVVDFMYKGEVNVSQDQLSALLKTAETLKVKGLAEVTGGSESSSAGGDGVTRSALGPSQSSQGGPPSQRSDGSLSPAPKRKRGRPSKRPSQDGDLEVVESLVDIVPDGPDSVPSNQDRSMDSTQNVKGDMLTEPSQSMADQTLNTATDMAYDGIPQDHTSNSRDSGMMMADQQQSSSSSSLGQLPATASTSGMSPGQGGCMTSDGGLSISITSGGPSHTVANSSCFNNVNTSVGTGSIYVTNISAAGGYSSGSNYWVRSPYRTGPCKSWREETMAQAIRSIFTRGTPIIEASRSTNIPYPTLFFYTNKVKQILKPYERTVPPANFVGGRRGRPTKTYCGSWPEEVIADAINRVVYRDYVPRDVSRDSVSSNCGSVSLLQSHVPTTAQTFPSIADSSTTTTPYVTPVSGSNFTSPTSVLAFPVLQQQSSSASAVSNPPRSGSPVPISDVKSLVKSVLWQMCQPETPSGCPVSTTEINATETPVTVAQSAASVDKLGQEIEENVPSVSFPSSTSSCMFESNTKDMPREAMKSEPMPLNPKEGPKLQADEVQAVSDPENLTVDCLPPVLLDDFMCEGRKLDDPTKL